MRSRVAVGRLCDHELIALVASGDVAAFGALYDRYHAQAFGMAVRVTRRRSVAEEITQDVFFSLWRQAGSYDPSRGSLRTWVLTLARYRGIDSLRHARRQDHEVMVEDDRLCEPTRTEEQVVQRDEARRVRGLVATLPSKQREALELAYFGGLTHVEIAARVGAPLGTVKGRLRLGLARLEGSLDKGESVGPTVRLSAG